MHARGAFTIIIMFMNYDMSSIFIQSYITIA